MTYFPVVLFVYKRPAHTARTLGALARCEGAAQTDLVVYSDGPKTAADADGVLAVRALLKPLSGFRSVKVVESVENRGLAASVIGGVGQVLDQAGACIVIEDDLDLAPGFLRFLNLALSRYQSDRRVFSLSGYGPPPKRVPAGGVRGVWFAPRPCSWGWAIWKDRWTTVDWDVRDRQQFFTDRTTRERFNRGGRDLSHFLKQQLRGELDSWAVRLAWSQSRVSGLTAYPSYSFVDNRGLDGSGTHSRAEGDQGIDLASASLPLEWPDPYEPSPRLLRRFRRHYEGTWYERWLLRFANVARILGGRR